MNRDRDRLNIGLSEVRGLRLSDLHRSTTDKKFMGVCGGIAEWLNVSSLAVRISVVALFFLIPPFSFIAYFVLGFLLDKAPSQDATEHRTWRDVGTAATQPPSAEPTSITLATLERRFAHIEGRLRRAEAEVTSKGFRFNRELRGA